jgi:GNAT superfamily N-acetyltransferase
MKDQISIRPVYNVHCQQIIDLILPIQQIEFNVPVTLDGQPDLLDIETNYYSDGGCFWGALDTSIPDNEALVGTIALMNVGYHAGVIRKMFVQKDYRGKELGIAQQLLEILVAYCREHEIHELYLGTVQQLKAAHRFYERNGFEEISVQQLPVYFPRMMADNKFYHLALDTPKA